MNPRNATRQPLLWAAVAFSIGILVGTYAWRPALWWLVAAAVFAVAAAWSRAGERWRSLLGYVAACVALAALGAWSVHAADSASRITTLSPSTDGLEATVTAHVVHDGILRGQGLHQRQSLDVETEQIERDGVATSIKAGVRLSLYGRGEWDNEFAVPADDAADDHSVLPRVFTYGQRLRFPVKLREPRNFQNPGAWDYRGYLLKQGVVATGSVAAQKVELLPGREGATFGQWCSRARRSVLAKIHLLWPRDQAGLFDAMLIGERSFIGRDTNAAWQRTGIYHILVVSGMNVGILAVVIFALLRRFRAGEILATVLTILLSIGYAWLAELGAPVLRSVLMLSIFLFTRLLYRDRALLNAIGAAALALLLLDPHSLFDPSFQLTFLSVAAIAGLAVPLLERTSEPYSHGLLWLLSPAYDTSLSPQVAQFRLELRMLAERVARLSPFAPERAQRIALWSLQQVVRGGIGIYEVIVVSASAQLAMTLPMTFYFHRATVVGLAANTLAVPLTGVLMTTSAAALALAYVWMPLAKIPALVATWALAGITGTVKLFADMAVSNLRLPTPAPLPMLVTAAAVVLAMLLIRRRALLAIAGMAALIAAGIWLNTAPARPQLNPGMLEVTAIDVGQAECTLVVTPQGRTLLVDAAGSLGPFQSEFDFGEDVISPYLWSRGITHLDAIALTHAHSDHMGGMRSVITNFHPQQFWLGPNAQSTPLRELVRHANESGVQVVARRAGQQFDFGGARIEVLAPPPDWELADKPRNNDSMVLRIAYGNTSALLTGDAEKKIEKYLAEHQPSATLLKAGHNGSITSTNPEFLAAVHPRFALIEVGAHNSFHHPRPEVLARLQQAHVATYRTDLVGAMTFLLDGNSVVPKPSVLR